MKLGKILTVVLLLILLTGVAYGIYTLGYPYLEKYLQAQKGPIDKGTPPEETIVAVAIDRASSGNLYSGEGGNVYFQFYENEIDWDSMRIAITYGDDKVQTISLTEDMLSEEDLESLERGGVNSFIVDIGGAQVIITIKIIPHTQEITYTVSFDARGGSEVPPVLSDANGLVSFLPSSSVKEGYVFKGWFTADDKLATAPLTVTGDITLYAKWRDLRTYEVTFLGKDGNVLKVEEVEHGQNATAPDAPQITGWEFIKWSSPTNNITSDKTIQAEYRQLKRQVVFRSSEWGVGNDVTIDVNYGESLPANLIPEVPAKVGYTAAWNRQTFNNITENIFVDAVYTIIKLTVTFWSDEWQPSEYVVRTVNYGTTLPASLIPTLPPQRTGYDLAWESKSLENITQNLDIKAVYTPKKYTIQFRRPFQSGGGSALLDQILADHDSHITPYDTGKGLPDYDVKWYTTPNPGPSDNPVDFATYVVTGPVIFFVKEIDLRIYYVNFAYNIGAGDVVFATAEVMGAGSPLLPYRPAAPQLEGYTFSAWSVPEDYTVSAHITVYALYYVNHYMVRFFERNTLIEESSKAYGTLITPPAGYDEEREGFTFEGWFTSPIFAAGTVVDFNAGVAVTGPINLYAKWVSLDKGSEGLEFNYVEISEGFAYYEIIGYAGYSDLEVKIPSMYEGLDVKGISDDAFKACGDITSIELPSELEYLGENAFANTYSLSAFTTKPGASFYKAVNGILYSADDSVLVRYPAAKSAAGFVIPASVTTIAKGAFALVNGLTTLEFEESALIERIEARAFKGCFELVSADLPDTITFLGEEAFGDCISLATVTGGEGLISVGKNAFESTEWLADQTSDFVTLADVLILYKGSGAITLDNNIVVIADGAFAGTQITSVTIGQASSLAYIGKEAFKNCVKLTTINILIADMPEIGANAFGGISGSATLYVPAELLAEYEANPALINFVNAGAIQAY